MHKERSKNKRKQNKTLGDKNLSKYEKRKLCNIYLPLQRQQSQESLQLVGNPIENEETKRSKRFLFLKKKNKRT